MLALVLASALVYANSLAGPFVFDDLVSIRDNPHVRSLSPLSSALTGVAGSGSSGRPVVALSLALNYALGGLEVRGYHLFNVAVHIAASLALFGFAKRALERTSLGAHSLGLSFAIALLWSVHPLNTDALNHVVYRNEALVALFIVLCLYAAERFFEGQRGWAVVAIAASALAMGSKELAVVTPLMVLAYDRTFVSSSFAAALSARRGFYAGLAATWIVLIVSAASGDRGQAVGFGIAEMSSLDYLRTQAGGIVHYLRLAIWPSPLVFDYFGWAPVRSWGPALLPGSLVLAVFVASLLAFRKRSAVGFLGLAFFAVLAPSSSFIPITGEWIAEHRMYLPLMAVSALLVSGAFKLLSRSFGERAGSVGVGLTLVLAVALAWSTHQRNEVYSSASTIWEDVLATYPDNARAHDQLALALLTEGKAAEALPHAEAALRLDSKLISVDYNLATVLLQLGQSARALQHFSVAIEKFPKDARLRANYGAALANTGARQEAERQLRLAVELDPSYVRARDNLALLLKQPRQPGDAAERMRAALEGKEQDPIAHRNLAIALQQRNDLEGALLHFQRAAELQPGVAIRQRELAQALERVGRVIEALECLREALRIEPDRATAAHLVQLLSSYPGAGVRDGAAAVALAESLTQGPGGGDPRLLDLLAAAYAEAGRFTDAVETARRAATLARQAGQGGLAADIGKRLQLYSQGKPFRVRQP